MRGRRTASSRSVARAASLRVLKWAGEPLFEKTPTAYARFRTLMRRTPVVFTPVSGRTAKAVLLLPGMPVSDGVLPVVEQQLAEVEGASG